MSIAYDAASNSSQSTGNLTWDHTPSGTPKGVLVFVLAADNGLDEVTGVTYGGVSLVEVALSPLLKTTTVPLAAHAYFLGSSVPTGVQEVVVTVSNADSDRQALCYTVTSSQDSAVQNTATWLEEATTDPTATLALSGEECWVALTALSDSNSVGAISPLSGWTSNLEVSGFFSRTGYWYRYNTVGTSDVTIGYDGTELTDSIGIGVAIKEVAVGPTEETVTFNSNSHIWDTVTATFNSNSHIYAEEVFNSNSHIWNTETETFNSNSHLYAEEVFNSNSHIWDTVTATFNSNSHIWDTETETFNSNSHLYAEETGTFNSNSHLYAEETGTFISNASILYNTITATFNSNSHIWDTITTTFNSNSNIWDTETETFNSDSNIYDIETVTFNSNSHLWDTVTETFNSNSNIWDTVTEAFNSDSNIYDIETATFNSNSYLWSTDTVTVQSDARIISRAQIENEYRIPKRIQPTMRNTDTTPQTGTRRSSTRGFRIL